MHALHLNAVFTSPLQNELLKRPFASRNISKARIHCKSSPGFHNTWPSASAKNSCSSLVSLAVLTGQLLINSSLVGLSQLWQIWSNQTNLHSLPSKDAVREEEEYQGLHVVLEASLILNSQMGDAVAERGRWKWSHFHDASAGRVLIQERVRCEGHITGGMANPV